MENEKQLDLIDRKALITEIQGTASTVCINAPWDADWFSRLADRQEEIVAMIERQPKVDAVEVVHGRWIKVHEWCGVEVYRCSACGREHPRLKTAYCCDCGAKMNGGNEDG